MPSYFVLRDIINKHLCSAGLKIIKKLLTQ